MLVMSERLLGPKRYILLSVISKYVDYGGDVPDKRFNIQIKWGLLQWVTVCILETLNILVW